MSDTGSPQAGDHGLTPGTRLGSYEIRGELGRGAMGIVYRAHDPALDREVAIKVITPTAADERYAQRLLREARIVGRLDHPHILGVYSAGQEGGRVYIVMPLVTGESLARRLERDHCVPLDEALRIVRETALALHAASEAGIVHRDIKPDNILIDARGHVKVADFGLSRDLNAQHSLTLSCDYVGTPRYSSPEQWLNQELDVRSDVYSLGVCLYEMLTGRPAFDASSLATLMQQILGGESPPIEVGRSDITPAVQALLHRMMATDPAQRPASAEALVAAIDGLRDGAAITQATIEAPPPTASAPTSTHTAASHEAPRPLADPLPSPPPADAPSTIVFEQRPHALATALILGLVAMGGSVAWMLKSAAPPAAGPPIGSPVVTASAATNAPASPVRAQLGVYIHDFRSGSGQDAPKQLTWLGVAGPNLMASTFTAQPWIVAIPRETVELGRRSAKIDVADDAGLTEVARQAGAHVFVRPTFVYVPGARGNQRLLLSVNLIDLAQKKNVTLATSSSDAPDEVLSCLRKLSGELVQSLADTYADAHDGKRPNVASTPSAVAWQGSEGPLPNGSNESSIQGARRNEPLSADQEKPSDDKTADAPPSKQEPAKETSRESNPAPPPAIAGAPGVAAPSRAKPAEGGAAPGGPGSTTNAPSAPLAPPEEQSAYSPSRDDNAKIAALTAYARGCELVCAPDQNSRAEAAKCFRQALALQPGFREAQEALNKLETRR